MVKDLFPIEWRKTELEEIADNITKGTTPTTYGYSFVDSGINFVKVESIDDSGKFKIDTFNKITEEVHEKLKRSQLKEGDLLLTIAGNLGRVAIVEKSILPANTNQAISIIRLKKNDFDNKFIFYFLKGYAIKNYIRKVSTVGAQPNLNLKQVGEIEVLLPPLSEQKKITSILSTWDKVIELKEKLIEQKKELKKGLMQKLITGKIRLPGFDGKWSKKSFEDIFTKISVKKHQIKTTEYLEFGEYPVVDQGQKKIIAYSNDKDKVLKVPDTGLIVFGDHTREIKFIDFDFVVGADGTQVLNTKEGYDLKFYYYHLLIQKIPNNGYSRHFKFLKEMIFFKPSLKEQKAISNFLSTFDNELDLLNSELKLLKQQKKGLMQLLLTGKVRVKV